MNKLTTEQYAAARRMIDEEVIGAYRSHKGQILDGWYDKLAAVLQFTEPEVFGSTLGPIPTEDETKGQYIGVPGVVPHPVKELLNNGHCPTCGADYTKPDVPFSHKSAAGNLMPGHADIPTTPAKRIPLYGLSMWEVSAAEKEINPVFDEIEDLLWDKIPVTDEYNDLVSNHNTLVYAGFLRGKQASVNTIKEQVTCPICVSGDTQRSNTNEHINEPKLPEGLDQLINEFARHRPNDLQIGKDFILEAFNRGLNVKKETPKDIEDLLWNDDEYESKDKQVNDRLIEAFRRGKGCK